MVGKCSEYKGKRFFQNYFVDGAGGKYFALPGNYLAGQKCARKRILEARFLKNFVIQMGHAAE